MGDDASCRTPASLEPGFYPVLATYSGDSTHGRAAVHLELTVEKVDTQVAAGTEGAVVAGASVVLTVSSLPAGATGTVVLSTGGTVLCTVVLPTTSCTTSALTSGTSTVEAAYSGDVHFSSSRTTFDVDVAVDEEPGTNEGSGSGDGSGGDSSEGSGSSSHHSSLAATGGPGSAPLVGGLLLLCAGFGALVLARRRRATRQ